MPWKKHSPGCPCCDDCQIDIDGWTQVSGTWTVDGDNLDTEDSNALAVTTNDHPEDKDTHYLSAIINGENDGDCLRLVVAYEDSNNYLYGEVEVGATQGIFRLFQVTGGSHFQLGLDSIAGGLKTGNDLTIRVCYRDDGLMIIQKYSRTSSTIESRYQAFAESPAPSGKKVGVATGSIDASSTATFSSVLWYIHKEEADSYSEGNDCPECREISTCNNCKDNIGHTFFKVTLAGLEDTGDCPCETNNRTIITQAGSVEPDGVCLFRWFAPEHNVCDNFTVYGADQLDVRIYDEVKSFAGLLTGNVRVDLMVLKPKPDFSPQTISFLYTLDEPIECLLIEDETANAQGRIGLDDPCDFTNATATITAI